MNLSHACPLGRLRRQIVTNSDYKSHPINLDLLTVYGMPILVTMGESKNEKLNRLLETLGDTTLVSSRWLRAHGYPSNLVARYMTSGWLQSPARGVYLRKGGKPTWEGLLHTLQLLEQPPSTSAVDSRSRAKDMNTTCGWASPRP